MRPTKLVQLFNNDRISSDANGNPIMIWTPEETWELGYQLSVFRIFLNVEQIDTNAEIVIKAEWSLDKREWFDFSTTPIGTTATTGAYTANSAATFDFGPYVRVGIGIQETPTPTTRKTATISAAVVLRLISE